jgi:hypothetical protein
MDLPSKFDAAPEPPSIPSHLSGYIQPTFNHGLRIWWAFFWRTTLISMVITFGINFGLRVIYERTNVPGNLIRPVMRLSPYVIGYTVALFIMEYILRKRFRGFRVGLLAPGVSVDTPELPATFGRTVRVWWTYSWRTILYRIIIMIAATIPLSVLNGVFSRIPLLQIVVSTLVMVAVDGAAGLFVIYSNILDEDFGDFRVCLLPREKHFVASTSPAATPATT